MAATISIQNTADAVTAIAALATKVIAAADHPGHTAEAVSVYMAHPLAQEAMARSYERHIANGKTVREAFIATGQGVVAGYCTAAGIPTTR